MKKQRRYSWIPDLPDVRDHLAPFEIKARPTQADLRHHCSPVEDQGNLGSCTGNAIVGNLEYLEWRDGKHINLSRLWVYYQERVIEHTVKQDAGASIRDGVKSVAKLGVCTEKLWPYAIAKFANRPSAKSYSDAATRKISEYIRVANLDSMLQQLAQGVPVIFGFTVYESFESAEVAKTGVVPMPGPSERLLGGHAVLAVGYDDGEQRVLTRNSWGKSWGMGGYFTLPYAYLNDRNLSDDFWSVRK